MEICRELTFCSFLQSVGFRLLYCFVVVIVVPESRLFKNRFAIGLWLNSLLWYHSVTPPSLVSSCSRCCADMLMDMKPKPKNFQNYFTALIFLTWSGKSRNLFPILLFPFFWWRKSTLDRLYLPFVSVLRGVSSRMEETEEEQQAWEPRDPEHVGKPWDWTCHLMCFLIIGDGICAEKAWFWMKSNGGKFLRYWVPPTCL